MHCGGFRAGAGGRQPARLPGGDPADWWPRTGCRTPRSRCGRTGWSVGRWATSRPSGATAPATNACWGRSSPQPNVWRRRVPGVRRRIRGDRGRIRVATGGGRACGKLDWTPGEAAALPARCTSASRSRTTRWRRSTNWGRAWWCPTSATTTDSCSAPKSRRWRDIREQELLAELGRRPSAKAAPCAAGGCLRLRIRAVAFGQARPAAERANSSRPAMRPASTTSWRAGKPRYASARTANFGTCGRGRAGGAGTEAGHETTFVHRGRHRRGLHGRCRNVAAFAAGGRVLTATDVHVSNYPTVEAVRWIGQVMEKETGGRGDPPVRSGQLGRESEPSTWRATARSTSPASMAVRSTTRSADDSLCLPYVFDSVAHMRHALDGIAQAVATASTARPVGLAISTVVRAASTARDARW